MCCFFLYFQFGTKPGIAQSKRLFQFSESLVQHSKLQIRLPSRHEWNRKAYACPQRSSACDVSKELTCLPQGTMLHPHHFSPTVQIPQSSRPVAALSSCICFSKSCFARRQSAKQPCKIHSPPVPAELSCHLAAKPRCLQSMVNEHATGTYSTAGQPLHPFEWMTPVRQLIGMTLSLRWPQLLKAPQAALASSDTFFCSATASLVLSASQNHLRPPVFSVHVSGEADGLGNAQFHASTRWSCTELRTLT